MGLLDTLMSGGYGIVADRDEEEKRRRMWGGMDDPNQTYGKVEQPKAPSWEEGGKFGWKDGLAMALTGIGDAFTRQGGGEGNALSTMMGNAMQARNASRKARIDAAKDQELTQRMIDVGVQNNMTPEQVMAQKYGLELPKAPEAPPMQRDLDTYNSWDETQKTNYAAMQRAKNAGMFRGEDGLMYPNTPAQQSGTAVGTVEDGYQFLGGDDKDQKNWRKVGGGVSNGTGGFPRRR